MRDNGPGLIPLRKSTAEWAGLEDRETDVNGPADRGICGHLGCELQVVSSADRRRYWHWLDTPSRYSGSYLQGWGDDGGRHDAKAPSDV